MYPTFHFVGYAESISFNVSSFLPLSPIPPAISFAMRPPRHRGIENNPLPVCPEEGTAGKDPTKGERRRSKRLKVQEEEHLARRQADIVMPSPDAGCVVDGWV